MNVAIIGAGYVGLTTGVCLADVGHTVVCVDNDPKKITQLSAGTPTIFEPDLEDLLKRNLGAQRLRFTTDLAEAVRVATVIFICVNTPPKPDGQADLKYVEQVARDIASHLNGQYQVIVDKSTVPVKTAEKVKETILRYRPDAKHFDVVSNPEFLREGSAIHDTLHPDRVVIGVESAEAEKVMRELYEPLLKGTAVPIRCVSVRSAELIKHGANTFLATKISYANIIAEVCEQVGADATEVLEAIGLDPRIGSQFLKPGLGFGGSCFPKDIAAFKKTLSVLGVQTTLIDAVEAINQNSWQRFLQVVERELWVLDGKKIAILGLAFKANTDDIRNAPALKIITRLQADGAKISAYDPQAMAKARDINPDVEYCNDPYIAATGAEALLVCTEWDEFKQLDLKRIKELMVTPIIFDGRGVIDMVAAKALGFRIYTVGRRMH